MKKIGKVLLIIFACLIAFVVIIFAVVGVSTAGIDEKANDVILKMQAGDIQSLHSQIQLVEQDTGATNGLTLEELTDAIVLPSGQADLRTISNVVWNERGFENKLKYIVGQGDLANGLKINIRLEFLEKGDDYIFYGINWESVQ